MLKKYEVVVSRYNSTTIEVMADSKRSAEVKALDILKSSSPSGLFEDRYDVFAVVESTEVEIKYPFEEGDDYWTIHNGELIWSCWDDVSEEIHRQDPDKRYFTNDEAMEVARANGIKICSSM